MPLSESSPLFSNKFAQVNAITLGKSINALTIHTPNCTALVSLYGGQVLKWQPKEQKDVFWLSDSTHYEQGKAIRGGIPLCWPWFGANNKNIGAGNKTTGINHGFARQNTWKLASITANETALTLVLSFKGEHFHALWPEAFELTQTLVFGESFKQHLSMANLSDHTVEYTGALHSYFRVSHPENVDIPVLNKLFFDDKLTGKKQCLQVSEAQAADEQSGGHCVGPIDRVYHIDSNINSQYQHGNSQFDKTLLGKSVVQLIDSQWQRTIEITSENTHQWVLWNPGQETANAMADIHLHGEQSFVCLEAANTQWQTISAGESVAIEQSIRIT